MKKIEAIIKPYKLNQVINELEKAGVNKLTAEEVKGFGRRKSASSFYKVKKGMNFILEYLPKLKLYIIAEEEIVDNVIEIILKNSSTKEIGDGKIFVTQVLECIDIRSGERGFCGNPG